MVCIQLTDRKGFLTNQACRSNMLHYQSDILNQVKVIFLSPFYVFGAKEEKQTLIFELFSDFEEDQVIYLVYCAYLSISMVLLYV